MPAHTYQEDPKDPGYCRCGLARNHADHTTVQPPAAAVPAADPEAERLRGNVLWILKEVGTWATCKGADCGVSGYWIKTRKGNVFFEEDGTSHFGRCKSRLQFKKGA